MVKEQIKVCAGRDTKDKGSNKVKVSINRDKVVGKSKSGDSRQEGNYDKVADKSVGA